ncbi:D-alanyl-lipoteichoic acid biosynthesis protein DltD [[Clostridium] symbiosum]|uniref:D-alanyl-lipoteichoic acid biosynthesis protein DltD n=1 Tax=Clostridium symbiosum TaxID=1512 RepID=UPI001D095F4B|nr:D-alanyl-lipoteichoic acid biosynthesis protein DltD [[Clostridium] symbiosum]MCB6610942.1 D-alanyl-lipoteichoic acid biosynthesis protein DltD [[Clostridium] symbiosum]MCB6931612.1 D-alanyl-lipoteichoic acid biosynthesis protein DltD [[Clostridium] symbiosum]
MRRILAFLTASVLFIFTWAGIYHFEHLSIIKKKTELTYHNTDERNSCMEAMEAVLDEKTIPVFGSSELSAADEVAYPPYLFQNGYSDFNMVLIGRGYTQSIHHAINVGALSSLLPDKKVVLILSPQWFTKEHLTSEIYASRFSERTYVDFMKNAQISSDTKRRLTNRMKTLLEKDPKQLKRIIKYEKVYLNHTLNPIEHIEMGLYNQFMDIKQLHSLKRQLKNVTSETSDDKKEVKAEQIDFGQMKKTAANVGKMACTNNEFGIYDDYYNTYVRDGLETSKNTNSTASYLDSQEYDDLRLFLDVCRETEITPLLVSVPVNGRWYDWTGFPKDDREGYYQKIREISEEYQVPLADFSDKEYELYFLKDVMHLGWKGWVYLDEAIYEFYKKDKSE